MPTRPLPAARPLRRLTRRAALAAGAGALAAALPRAASAARRGTARGLATPAATPGAPAALADAVLEDLAADVEAARDTFRVPGAAVALVQGDEVAFARGFGLRDLAGNAPVTPRTRFRVGSVTKSMTALLLATLADDGALAWDDRAVDLWPGFRAPSDELTRTLRLRDLLGMGSGVAESADLSLPVVEFFMMAGETSAADVLGGVADLPVVGPPGATYAYNNTLVSAAAYLGLLAAGAPDDGLAAAYAAAVRERVFGPLGMAGAAIAEDPRPLGEDHAVGYTRDLFGTPSPLPFVPLAGIAPAGSGLAGAEDLARYLIAHMNGGVGPGGGHVVSAANLAELFRPGVAVDVGALAPPGFMPDTVGLRYCMGWVHEEFRDGRRLLWHSGGIDGFATLAGFLPDDGVGFALLANEDRAGGPFNLSVRASLLGRLFGLEAGLPAFLAGAWPQFAARTAELAAQTRPVDPAAVRRFLGYYEDGFRLRHDEGGGLWIDHGLHVLPLLALPDGTYVVADGPDVVLGQRVAFAADADMTPVMTVAGFAPVRWLSGG